MGSKKRAKTSVVVGLGMNSGSCAAFYRSSQSKFHYAGRKRIPRTSSLDGDFKGNLADYFPSEAELFPSLSLAKQPAALWSGEETVNADFILRRKQQRIFFCLLFRHLRLKSERASWCRKRSGGGRLTNNLIFSSTQHDEIQLHSANTRARSFTREYSARRYLLIVSSSTQVLLSPAPLCR
jgi:hypothetical protein